MFNKIKNIKAMSDYRLLATFADGKQKLYDVKPLFSKWQAFELLRIVDGLFEQVKVDLGGYGISWNDDIDLSCDEIYENGIEIEKKITPQERYAKKTIKQYKFDCMKSTEEDIINKMESVPNKARYIKNLIRKDISSIDRF